MQPTRLLHPWDFPGKSTGMGCHCLLQFVKIWAPNYLGFPGGASAGDIRDTGSIPGSGKSTGGGHGNPLQYSCLENPMDRGAWWATAPGATKSPTQLKWLSTHVACIQLIFIEGKNYPFSTALKTNLLYMKSHVVLFLDSLFCSVGLFVYPCNNTTLT